MSTPQPHVNGTAAQDLPPERPTQAELHHSFPTGDPRVMRWARIAGRVLPAAHRHIFNTLSCYVNPDTGMARPSQDTLAADTGYSRTNICEKLLEIEYMGGLLTSDGRFYQDQGSPTSLTGSSG